MTIELNALQLIDSRAEVASILKVKYKSFIHYTVTSKPEDRYNLFEIKKKNGAARTITSPCRNLKIIQWRLNDLLNKIYKPKASVQGFAVGRGILTNAHKHTNKKHVLNLDLKDFFPSINFGRVRGMFMAEPYKFNKNFATILAQVCCHNNQLPQGAPTSPIISNMLCARLDSNLKDLAVRNNCTYSRYADDITFSTTAKKFPERIARVTEDTVLGEELIQIIKNNGFDINFKKVRLQKYISRQEVTGLVVNKFPNVRRKLIRQVRAMLNAWETYGLVEAQREYHEKYNIKHRAPYRKKPNYQNVVEGKLEFVKQIKGDSDPVYQALEARYLILVGKPARILKTRDMADKAVWVLECEEEITQGTAFFLKDIGLITCNHCLGKAPYAYQPQNPSIKYPTQLIASEPAIDLAILKIDAPIEYAFEQRPIPELKLDESVKVVGYPNYNLGDTVSIMPGVIAAIRPVSSIKRLITSARIVVGNSGGPVLDDNNLVVGIATTGAKSIQEADSTEFHSIIPIDALKYLVNAK